jgi:hypothetical protein
MRIMRDVIVSRTGPGELLAVSHTPGVMGELLTLELSGGAMSVQAGVVVLESRPVIVGGGVRHRIRLALQQAGADESAVSAGPGIELDRSSAEAC